MRDVWKTSGSVLRQLAANLNVDADGLGEILDNASPDERERMLNSADAPLQAQRAREQFQASHTHLVERDETGCAWQSCGYPTCATQPLDPNGLPVKSPLVQWWCSVHKAGAPAEDLEAWRPPYALDPATGLWVDTAREAIEHEQAEREQRQREARRAMEQAEREQYARDLPPMDDSPWLPSGPGWWS